jgi:hypothetical protein
MLSSNRLSIVILLSVGIAAATTAQAGVQLFEASWSVKAFGNEITGGTGEEEFYSAIGIPFGAQCNANQPRCPWESTPTDGSGNWSPLGGSQQQALFCAPWYNWGGYGATARPSKHSYGYSYSSGHAGTKFNAIPPPYRNRNFFARAGQPKTGHHTGMTFNVTPPLYRNTNFFTSAGQPNITACTAISTGYTTQNKGNLGQNRGRVQVGNPVTGTWGARTTGAQRGAFDFRPVPKNHKVGIRTTGQIGELAAVGPYLYRYTYATLRNGYGAFGPGSGPGSFNLLFEKPGGSTQVASINVKQGAAKFGGTMQMLGALTSKVCYFRNGGCSLGRNNWRYDAIGASFYPTLGGGITEGYIATYKAYYYHTFLMQQSTVNVYGSRFPWTTGSVTVTAAERGPHSTVHYHRGYDNRNTTTPTGTGTIQLVTPVLTRWYQPAANHETAGIGILRIKFVPEPQTWAMLVAGVSLLGVVYRLRGR